MARMKAKPQLFSKPIRNLGSTQTLKLALALGVGAGSIYSAGLLDGVVPAAGAFLLLGFLLTYLFSPALIAIVADRNPFLWSVVPGLVAQAMYDIATVALSRNQQELPVDSIGMVVSYPIVIAVSVSLVAGPITLVRLFLRRRDVLVEEPKETVLVTCNEDAWPPAPKV